ncbi:hypothetical protein BC940DRAFT_349600 [Gongronella butleri]|nr:hypothetical protein BC940DRAFT_349600 [Gongronella butleri]
MVDPSPSDLIDGMDKLHVSMLSKSTPARTSSAFTMHRRHYHEDSTSSSSPASPPLPTKSQQKASNLSHVPCKFFKQGTCTAGANCVFSHNLAPSTETVCKYFLKGNCKFGTKCALLHTMVPSDLRRLLQQQQQQQQQPMSQQQGQLRGGVAASSYQQQQNQGFPTSYALSPSSLGYISASPSNGVLGDDYGRSPQQASSPFMSPPPRSGRYSTSLGSAPISMAMDTQQQQQLAMQNKLHSIAEIFHSSPSVASHDPHAFMPPAPPPSLASSASHHTRAHSSYLDRMSTSASPSYLLDSDIWSNGSFRLPSSSSSPNGSSAAINIPRNSRAPPIPTPSGASHHSYSFHAPAPSPLSQQHHHHQPQLSPFSSSSPFLPPGASSFYNGGSPNGIWSDPPDPVPTRPPASSPSNSSNAFQPWSNSLTPPANGMDDSQDEPFHMDDPDTLPQNIDTSSLGFGTYTSLVRPN